MSSEEIEMSNLNQHNTHKNLFDVFLAELFRAVSRLKSCQLGRGSNPNNPALTFCAHLQTALEFLGAAHSYGAFLRLT